MHYNTFCKYMITYYFFQRTSASFDEHDGLDLGVSQGYGVREAVVHKTTASFVTEI